MVALQYLSDVVPPLDVATARADVERFEEGLPRTLLALRPEEIRRLARRALDAERAALRRRSKVGEEPTLDESVVARAMEAHDAVRAARAGERDAVDDSMRWLAIGNVWGIGGLAVAGVLVFRGIEPTAAPVYASVVTGATGPLATMLLGLTRRSVAALRVATAVNGWADALATAGFETMGELHARRLARASWVRRQQEAVAANTAARDARAQWHRVAGPHHHPREAPALIGRVAELRAAQLELLRALLAERMRPRELATASAHRELDTGPMETLDMCDDAVPFDVAWAVPEPVLDVTTDEMAGGDRGGGDRAGMWSRLRDRTVRVWSR